MQELAKLLPEYPVVREMGGVGIVLAPKLIAEIGDVRRFHWKGIDSVCRDRCKKNVGSVLFNHTEHSEENLF